MIHNIRIHCFKNINRKLKDVKASRTPINMDVFCELIILAHEPDIFRVNTISDLPFVDYNPYWCLVNLDLMHVVNVVGDPTAQNFKYRACELTPLGKMLVDQLTNIRAVSDKIFDRSDVKHQNVAMPSYDLDCLNIKKAYDSIRTFNSHLLDRLTLEAYHTRESLTELVLNAFIKIYKPSNIKSSQHVFPSASVDRILKGYTCNHSQELVFDYKIDTHVF